MKKIWITILVGVICILVFSMMFVWVKARAVDRAYTKAQLYAQINAGSYVDSLEKQRTAVAVLEEVLVSGDGELNHFSDVAERLMNDTVKNITLAPDGVVTQVYPESESKDSSTNLFEDEKSNSLSQYCLQHMNNVGISGPFAEDDSDGETIVIVQKAVELNDEFWGFVVVVQDVESIIATTGDNLAESGYEYCLTKTVEPGSDEEVVVTSSQDKDYFDDAQSCSFSLGGCEWNLMLVPTDGWLASSNINLLLVVGIFIIVLITLLVFAAISLFEYGKKQVFLTRTDALTGLNNRLGLQYEIDRCMQDKTKHCYTLIALDIDDFKLINDIYGHLIGDEILKQLAQNLRNSFPKDSIIGRNGGDEFIILLKNIAGEQAKHMLDNFYTSEQVWKDASHKVTFSVSMGYAEYPLQADSITQLLQLSDAALYEVKMRGKHGFEKYHEEINSLNRSQLGFTLQDIVSNIPGAIFVHEASGQRRILFANQNLFELFECENWDEFQEYNKNDFKNIMHPDDWEGIEAQIKKVEDGEPIQEGDQIRFRVITKNNHSIWVNVRGKKVQNKYYGQLHYVLMTKIDNMQ